MFFDFGRQEGYPTQYGPNQTPVTVDILEVGVIAAFAIVYISLLLFIPGRNLAKSVYKFVRITISLAIGLMIILGNIGQEWEVAHIETVTPYKAGSHHEINASIAVKIGLRSVNVTLKSISQPPELLKEIINYNERFSWEWDQGRFGFGPYAGRIQQEFRAAQYRGLPLPILWIVDYFVIDGEGYRHGRFYRTAGWYTHIAIWIAFPCWIIANILFLAVIHYGACLLAISGALLLTGNLLWCVIRNPAPLVIPFETKTIFTKYGPSFWLTFVNGILCLSIALVIYFMNRYKNKALYSFFGVDNLTYYEESYVDNTAEDETPTMSNKTADIPLRPMGHNVIPSGSDEDIYINLKPVYVKRSIYKRSHKRRKPPPPPPREQQEVYINVGPEF